MATFKCHLSCAPGRAALHAQLALSTGQPEGRSGSGWTLAVPAVRRRTDKRLPRYDGSDTLLAGADELVAVPGAPTGRQRYAPRGEGLFARVEWIPADGC